MRELWADERKFSIWLEIEVLACEAMASLGLIPSADAEEIRAKAHFSIPEIEEIEKRTQHDVIAFLENVASYVGPAARWIHQGLTSSDILDTTLAVQLIRSCDILLAGVQLVRQAAERKALEYKYTPMIGRSHGIHAEPITFGLKMALMYDEFGRAQTRLRQAREAIAVGKLSGAVGTHAHLDPRVEEQVCRRLGLKPDILSTQVVQRDRHAEFSTTLGLVASSVDRWATEFRHLQRTEVLEAEEFFSPGQKGSSAMPHKRNPITAERLTGLARILRGNSVAALEDVALWHERDISHSSVERIIFPDSCTLLDYMLVTLTKLTDGLIVYPENMKRNLALTLGMWNSQTILLALIRKGLTREEAYDLVQRNAMKTWQAKHAGDATADFKTQLLSDPDVAQQLSRAELDKLCNLGFHFSEIKSRFKKLGL